MLLCLYKFEILDCGLFSLGLVARKVYFVIDGVEIYVFEEMVPK